MVPSAFGAPPGARCSFLQCRVTEEDGGILIAQKGGAYLCLAHHNANRPRRAIPPEPEEPEEHGEPGAPPERARVVRTPRKPGLSVSFVAESEATVDAERIRRNMQLFASGPQYTFARPGEITSAHKRREQALVARAPKDKIAELDPRICAYFDSTSKFV